MQPAPWEPRGERRRVAAGLHPTEIGDAVHRLLELVDLASAVSARRRRDRGARRWLVSGRLGGRAGADRRRSSRAYTGSALAARIAGLEGVRPERPFAFELDGVLVNGRLDVLWLEGERALVLDYKTNALARSRPGGDRRGGVPDPADRLRDRLPALRRT